MATRTNGSEYTLNTLKELLESEIDALENSFKEEKNRTRENARSLAEELKKQATEYERRLSDLNHENARIAASNAKNVSRDTHDAFVASVSDWQKRTDRALAEAVTGVEFRAYQTSTSAALTLKQGERKGAETSWQGIMMAVTGISAVIAIILALFIMFKAPSTPAPTAVYLPSPAQGEVVRPAP